jgi:CheY-like chemotaxis protein
MRSLNVLVAEDDVQNQAMLKLILTRRGHRVRSAWNGLQAVEAIKAESFDVALMDVQMPEMDGLEATRQIRAWEDGKHHLPIVILTGSVPPEISDSYKIAGADTFIAKPFDVKRLEFLINIMASEEPNASQTASIYILDGALDDLAVLDEVDALARFDGDWEMFHDNLSEFIKGIPSRLERLRVCLAAGQWQDVSLQAHNLKGVSANYGANVLSVLAFRLDEYSHAQRSSEALNVFKEIEHHLPVLTEIANNIITKNK